MLPIIAGNGPETRVDRLKEFLEMVVVSGVVESGDAGRPGALAVQRNLSRVIATFGVPGFFTPRLPRSRPCGRRAARNRRAITTPRP